jgi:hypothetical protein
MYPHNALLITIQLESVARNIKASLTELSCAIAGSVCCLSGPLISPVPRGHFISSIDLAAPFMQRSYESNFLERSV